MWLYVALPHLQLERMQVLHPDLQGQPAVLYTEQQQMVVQFNQTAQRQGIRVGMNLADAWTLTENLQPYLYRESQQRALLQHLASDLYHAFAVISLDPPLGLWLDTKPMQKLYPQLQHSLTQLELQLQPWQVSYTLGAAKTPLLAKMLAQSGMQQSPDIPVDYLPCSPELQKKLRRMGIQTLGALQAIPRALAGRRLGHELVQLLARIQGEQPESLRYFRPPEWFTQRLPLLAEATSWQALSFPLKRLLQELEHFLESRQQQTRQLLLSFYHRDGSVSKLQVGLAHGGYQAEALLRLCQLKMESTQFLAPVLDIGLQAKQLQGRQHESRDLLQGASQAQKSLAQLLNELQLRLGRQQVFGLQTAAEAFPDLSWQLAPAGAELGRTELIKRPPWLLEQPCPVDIRQWQLTRGPERFATPWWLRTYGGATRDYWQALHQDGRNGWLFYDYRQQHWYLQGWFN